jgi:hypothetical protein
LLAPAFFHIIAASGLLHPPCLLSPRLLT